MYPLFWYIIVHNTDEIRSGIANGRVLTEKLYRLHRSEFVLMARKKSLGDSNCCINKWRFINFGILYVIVQTSNSRNSFYVYSILQSEQ